MYRSPASLCPFPRRYGIAIALAIFIIWMLGNSGPDLETIRDFANLEGGLPWNEWMTQKQFVRQALKDDIYVKGYNGSAVRKLCSEAKWREGVVISCDQIAGGIGNLKMRVLGCTRYAIEAGAMLVRPAIHPREAFAKMETSFKWDVDLPLDYVFDSDHFYSTLAEDCPQLRIVSEGEVGLNIPTKNQSHLCEPLKLVPTSMGEHLIIDPGTWRPAFDLWLQQSVLAKYGLLLSATHPVRITLDEGIQFSWPTGYDGPDFKNDWGHIARFRRDIRELSARALYNLYQRLGCKQNPATVSKDCFLGAHIRTEADAQVEAWDTYETQLQHVREQLLTHNLSTLYVATGTASDVDRLKVDLKDMRIPINITHDTGVQVLQKWDVIGEDDMMLMDSMTWDQMALVDLDIMLRASRFEGIWESSWTWMIALKRNEWSTEIAPFEQGTTFEDGLSRIYGNQYMQPFIPPTIYL